MATITTYRMNPTVSIDLGNSNPSREGGSIMRAGGENYLDNFNIQAIIGAGSYSRVLRAENMVTKQVVALKQYQITPRSNLYDRAAAEMAFLRMLSHENIIQFVDCDIRRGSMCLAIEYSQYGSLCNYMNPNQRLSEGFVRVIMKQVISALVYLHSMHIMHGDIKPANIIVMNVYPNFIVKLTDFGLSEVVYSEAYTTQSGTFYYMSPEIHLGYLCDTTSDLYSAGVVMYELLYGRKPYPMHMPKKDFKMLLRLATPVQFPRERTAMLSGNCMNLLRGLLSYDKRERTFGNEIAYHPFLDIDKMCSSLNHYNEGYKFLSRSVDLAKQRQYGLAYVDANQAILHFEIHCKSLIHDMALYSYLRCKLVEYDIFSEQIKLQLTNCNGSVRYLYMPLHTEKLRCMLSSSPALLAAYDLCLVGEMWINRNDRDIGIQKLKDGMEIMSIVLPKAPESEQKWLLLQKYTQWSRRLVKLKAMRKDALPVQSR